MLRPARGLALAFAAAGALVAGSGGAQTAAPSIDARTFRPPTDPRALMVLEPVSVPAAGAFHVSAWGTYSVRPVWGRDPAGAVVTPVLHAAMLDLVAGLGVGGRASLAASVPLVLYQRGTAMTPRVPSSAIGDLGVHGKVTLKDNADGGLGLAAVSTVTLPSGEGASFAGEGELTASARFIVDYSFFVAGAQASLGYKARTSERSWDGARLGGEIPWTLGVRLRPAVIARGLDSGGRQMWELAARGALPAGPVAPFGGARLAPVLLSVSDRVELGRYHDAFVLAGVDVGLGDAIGVPVVRGVLAVGWAPQTHDVDHDGVPDDVDQCKEIAEDRDGYEDDDGCPEIDDDGDGVVDEEDACPRVAGGPAEDPKKNGCPEGAKKAADRDGDEIPDAQDGCPDQPEDKDGFQDDDGCPDPDDDGDGVSDASDACPRAPGEPSMVPAEHGCPSVDRDGDTYPNDLDRCPDSAETWNGVADDDGCPDEGGKPLVVVAEKAGRATVRLAIPIKLTGGDDAPQVDPASMPAVRALASELVRRPGWTLAVGARPRTGGKPDLAQAQALVRAFAVVRELAALTRRDGAAETVGWDAVKTQPGSEGGLGLLVLVAAPP